MDEKMLSPIFIVGAPRSGTTLVTEMLNRHPKIFIFNESLYYDFSLSLNIKGRLSHKQLIQMKEHICQRIAVRSNSDKSLRELFTLFSPQEKEALLEEIRDGFDEFKIKPYRGSIFQWFMFSAASMKDKQRWGEKTPSHVFYLHQILMDFPEAKVINMIRDPYDFLLSYKYAWQRGGEKLKKIYHPIITSLLWRKSASAINEIEREYGGNVLTIRYEDLVENSRETFGFVLSFIGEDYVDVNITSLGKNTSFKNNKSVLDLWEKDICGFICGKVMKKSGYYRVEPSPFFYLSIIKALLLLPIWFLNNTLSFFRRYNVHLIRYFTKRI